MANEESKGPALEVRQLKSARRDANLWAVSFEVVSRANGPVSLLAAWLPHGRFRCQERSLEGSAPLPSGGRRELSFSVSFDEPPGTIVENAFVILRVRWRRRVWRVLARLSVTAAAGGGPEAVTEVVTTHHVGFSE